MNRQHLRHLGGKGIGLLILAFSGGATADTIEKPIMLNTQRGFALESVRAIAEGEGVRFHGAICRRSIGSSPRIIRADRLDAGGNVISTATRVLWGLRGRERHCIFFDLPTPGPVMSGEQFRVCTLSTNRPCPQPVSAASSSSEMATKGRP